MVAAAIGRAAVEGNRTGHAEAIGPGRDLRAKAPEGGDDGIDAVRFLRSQLGGVADERFTFGEAGEDGDERQFVDRARDERAADGRGLQPG